MIRRYECNLKIIKLFLLLLIVLISACSQETDQIRGKDTNDEELNKTIVRYFQNFDDINKWSEYATDDFVKRVYSWCSGDYSEEKTIDEMKDIYYEINSGNLALSSYSIDEITKGGSGEIIIMVTRYWENGAEDQTSYSLVKQKDTWKFNNRF